MEVPFCAGMGEGMKPIFLELSNFLVQHLHGCGIVLSAGDKMNRKIPTRKCIGCGELKEKNQLVRIVRSKEGEISLDMTGKKNGRGAYICPDPQCLKQAFKKKGLDRSFKIGVPESVYETLKKEMEELYE